MAAQRLHGTINATITGADNVYDPARITGKIPFIGDVWKDFEEATGLGRGLTRMYATVDLDGWRIARTRTVTVPKERNPRWNERVRAYCAHNATDVVFSVMIEQRGTFLDTLLGRAFLPVQELLGVGPDDTIERRLDILDADKRKLPGRPKIHMMITFRDVEREGTFGGGIDGATFSGVPNTFFSDQQACRVTLYQDAHASDTFTPTIPLAGGGLYNPGKCWEDLFDAISNAKYLVYITGWSVFTDITLVRDRRPGGEATLGELLKRKADEGVRVLMLVWNDFTSGRWLSAVGLTWSQMGTSDEQTARYFRGSRVQCVLCERKHGVTTAIGNTPRPEVLPSLSHHQKSIIVDQELPSASGERQIISFLGGLDVCNGRYDTQEHSLFRTIGTGQPHSNDFYQGNLAGATIDKGGPRQPWHDVHSKIEGPAAWDVLNNFEQRWRKQGGVEDLLVDLAGSTVMPSSSPAVLPDDEEAWNVQLFRSIDDNSTLGFPDNMEAAHEAGLVPGKHKLIERSIQDAYIHAIRAAKSFIYIENQYFVGSSFQWKESINLIDREALNQIPRELSLKIVRKIEARERFTVYVVLPMWPEGGPEGSLTNGSVPAILDLQRRTMEMMYDDIGSALRKMNMDDTNPREYLTFFCLGNREVKKSGEYQPTGRPEAGTNYARAQKARRGMIYVHSKLMIVDDEYVILGSANVNERSLHGARDSEIAIGGYQPHRLNTKEEVARGQIHGFRMSLWYEHLGITHGDFLDPGSLACVKRVNQTADKYWSLYAADQFNDDLPGHLLTYPIAVNKAGTVSALKGFEFFPDTKALVSGTKSGFWTFIVSE